jgi:hypothetical protein
MQNGITKNNKIIRQGKNAVATIAFFLSLVIPVSSGLALTMRENYWHIYFQRQAMRNYYANEQIDIERLATAIYFAEGGARTSHPYGILVHYVHTSPRQACINSIKHRLRDWDGKGDFICYLAKFYCPVGAANDPTGLNKNWIKNVRYFYNNGRRSND